MFQLNKKTKRIKYLESDVRLLENSLMDQLNEIAVLQDELERYKQTFVELNKKPVRKVTTVKDGKPVANAKRTKVEPKVKK